MLARNVARREHVDTVIVRQEKLLEKGRLSIAGINEEKIKGGGMDTALSIMRRLRESSTESLQ